ncbi:YceI family protein [bacterium]|nr:YceI family protein [bacterium]
MRSLFIFSALLATNLFAAPAAKVSAPAVAVYKVVPADSQIKWVGKKLTGQHNGTIAVKEGKIEFQGDALKSADFTAQMTTIKVLDLTDAKYNHDLTEHLNSEDFFSTAKHPTANFKVTKVTQGENGAWNAEGPFTIKGITKTVTIPLTVTKTDKEAMLNGKVTLDRTLWDIKYRSGKFFPEIGDKLIHDGFDIDVTLKAKKS